METSVAFTSFDAGELLNLFLDNPQVRRQRTLFSRFLGDPIWWLVYPANGKRGPFILHPRSIQAWSDPRLEELDCKKDILEKLKTHSRESSPYALECKKHRLRTYCIPLWVHQKPVGVLCVSHLRPAALRNAPLELLQVIIHSTMESACKDLELHRLSESVRPRAIALSTVHTVHRIINSTLNLDELVNRLAHLTAQVLRAKSCAIYLSLPEKTPPVLIEKARAGPTPRFFHRAVIRSGQGIEGKVFQSAKNVLRKNTLCVPLIDEDVIGVISLSEKRDLERFDSFDQEILTTMAEEAVVAIKNAQLYEEQKKVTLGTIQSLAAILGMRFAHPRKLSSEALLKITLSIADELKCSEGEKQAIHYATLLKDAGKIGLPDEIIKKPTKLTGDEYRLVRQHPIKGAMIVQSFESLKPVAPIILYSHENYDGSGYPRGLKEDEIPLGARILAVVNAFDALFAGRPYKTRKNLQEALAELKSHKGTQFDPQVVDAFEKVIAKPPLAKLLAGM